MCQWRTPVASPVCHYVGEKPYRRLLFITAAASAIAVQYQDVPKLAGISATFPPAEEVPGISKYVASHSKKNRESLPLSLF
ncbi:hypothetical protein J6590_005075 [Homalodisca vitripennis]|nr:hypothetical protein J6590_005075 [Homalodisca vitripennis]